ncbi:MazG-like family protein [Haloparvum sp. AD34]
MDQQDQVAAFLADHEMEAPLPYRLLDLASEVGELAKEATTSTDYGTDPGAIEIADDEIGDALFALLSVAEAADVDADDALQQSLAKYERRIEETGEAGSGA